MKIPLTQDLIYRLNNEKSPKIGANKKIVFEPHSGSEYIVYDAHQNSPRGFGVRVGKTSKRYIVQRKIGSSITKWVVGNCAEITLEEAREAARKDIARVKETGRHPKKIVTLADKNAGEWSLGDCFDHYINRLKTRATPAKDNTLKSINTAREKLKDWESVSVSAIKPHDVTKWFDGVAVKTRTAAEAAARWATMAVNSAIENEWHEAKAGKRKPSLDYNPFTILKTTGKYRLRKQLEQEYRRKGIRNPMTMESLGDWLKMVWTRRSSYPTGADFLLLTLLWGMRRGEACKIKWRHRISATEAKASSYVDLKKKIVFVFDPKNRMDHELPLAPCALELLRRREEDSRTTIGHSSIWVFPARSTQSKKGYYSDPQVFFRGIRDGAKIEVLRPHDLRRTFGRVAESLQLSVTSIRRLLNHSDMANSTGRYTELEDKRIEECMERIERNILDACPEIFRALAPIKLAQLEGERA